MPEEIDRSKQEPLAEIKVLREKLNALKISNERFKTLLNNVPMGYQSLDENGDFIEVNDSWCEMLGYTREEAIGRNFSEFIHPDLKEAFNEKFREFKTIGHVLGTEFEMIRKDGTHIVASFHGRSGYDEDGSFRQSHCILKDVTEQKRVEEALRESEAKHRSYIDNAPDGVFVVDRDGHYVEVNGAATELTGYAKDELLNMSVQDLLFPDDLEEGLRRFKRLVETGRTGSEIDLRKKDGTGVTVALDAVKINENRFIGFCKDITEHVRAEEARKEHEAQLQNAQRLAANGRIVAGIAHEINNPLASIKSGFMLVREAVSPDHKYAHYVRRIDREIDRMALIVKQMYQLYSPESKELTPQDLKAAIDEICLMFERKMKAKRFEFELDLPKEPPKVSAPNGQIYQVLSNLVQNAIQASSPESGRIRIAIRPVNENDRFLNLDIADRGEGIPPENLPMIFDPFFTTKEGIDQEGMGLGLSVSLSMIRSLGGDIAVESKVGEGTTFTLQLPVFSENENQSP